MSQTVNQYFNVLGTKPEQRLIEDLVIESIKINGLRIFYIPRTLVKEDPVFGEDPLSKFIQAFPIEAYFDNPQGFNGNRDMLSKFGIQLQDQASFIVSRRRFNQAVKYDGYNAIPNHQYTTTEVRPMEGDLIYLPLTNDLFQINFAEHESVFYQVGYRYVWRIDVEKFMYSSETIQTGIAEIDKIQQLFENVDNISNDPLADNDAITTEADTIIDFDETNPFGEIEQ